LEKHVKEEEQFYQSTDALQNDCENKGREKTPTGSKKPLKRASEEMQKEITEHEWALPFLLPVDVVGLGLHDYYQVIKKPMDFKTIKRKIKATDDSSYKNIHEIYEDVRLIFMNAMKYNDVKSTIHAMAKTLLEIFENKWLELLPKVSNAESQLLKEESHKRLYKTLVPEATRGLSAE
ncbi:transcription factor GTE1-like, partial [Trifolium medium]|nr:transcription factor GTE1-like [Trifolium medium]